jgi:mycothiol synthase
MGQPHSLLMEQGFSQRVSAAMKLRKRMYQSEQDYWRLRAFLREAFMLNEWREFSWQVARLDYWRYFGNEHLEHYALTEAITLWETDDGRIAAFVTPESRGHAYLQVHPALRTPELEHEMLEAAETHLAEPDAAGRRHLTVWCAQPDSLRQQILHECGYTRGEWAEHQFRRCLDSDIASVQPGTGYTIRSLGDTAEIPARSWLSWRVFHPDEL